MFALNYFKVIHLWGKKAPVVVEAFPEPDMAPTPEPTPAPVETLPLPGTPPDTKAPAMKGLESPTPGIVPTGDGRFTVQFSAWQSKAKADEQASLLTAGRF